MHGKDPSKKWQMGCWHYEWYANGMLKSVQKPSGAIVSFEYDALERRTAKIANAKIYRYLWDGNVLLQQWSYDVAERPKLLVSDLGELFYNRAEPITDLVSWIYEQGSFTPIAKLQNGERYSIISDYLGTPIQAFDSGGELIWERELNIYGGIRKEKGIANFVAMRYQGQYFDEETELCYNRHRYFESSTGLYISKDPISLLSGELNQYSYVRNTLNFVDIFGLEVVIGQVGTYGDLLGSSEVGDDLELHHIPQDKLGHLPRKDGIAVVMPKSEHAQTRTYKSKGRVTAAIDQNRAFKDVLKDDLVDLRKIGGAKYDDSIKNIIKEYEDLGKIKKGELTLSKIKKACK